MSFNSFLQPTQTLCQQAIPGPLVAGFLATAVLGNANQPFYGSTSKIIGVSGGVAGNKYSITINAITQAIWGASQAQISIASSSNADTSNNLVVYWINTSYPGTNPC